MCTTRVDIGRCSIHAIEDLESSECAYMSDYQLFRCETNRFNKLASGNGVISD